MRSFVVVFFFVSFLYSGELYTQYWNHSSWQANAHISVSKLRVTATVINQGLRPIKCSGFTYGQTQSGFVASSWMNSQVLPPGGYAHFYVYTNAYNPFVNGWADVRCFYVNNF